ncbi:vanadium-dependent haloperoxidase [Pleomorphovibrio marinus]|uniref:vanadium-dependent haloperoxidase n=1 Tax=Pleomorphovibrio marinus TaxID=2164132 RepID=UPI000E0C4DB4|nr:vanadium-dependent haloperoxidase [Pleomorphovibrio marinus]
MNKGYYWCWVVFILFVACEENEDYKTYLESGDPLIQANLQLTDVMVHDIFSPPVASRIYAYPAIAAFEVAAIADPELFAPLMGQLNQSKQLEVDISEEVYLPLAAIAAYYKVGAQLVFSEKELLKHRDLLYERARKEGLSKRKLQASIRLGEEVGANILEYAAKDNYHQSRSFEKYTIKNDPGTWKPTPPAYMEGIEPHWNKIRPFVLDSANQYIPKASTPFDIIPESDFFQEAKEVMDAGKTLSEEEREIAYFWDCNPYKMNVKGHVMYAEKKITPGGHWMGIAGIASKAKDLSWESTAEALAYTSVFLFDGFIACWDEKYRSILIRPETYINLYMDEDWLPLLQTPPFPEYTSGHSVISTAAAKALTNLLGEPFHIVDSTEVKYGLGIREFDSFNQAAAEAAISRFYGGIHYIPAIDNGVEQGEMVANHILNKIHTRRETLASFDKE